MWSKILEVLNPHEAIKATIFNNETKKKNKFTPSIMIYMLDLADKEHGYIEQRFCFLSYKRLHKFLKRHEEELNEYKVIIGGEQLWLW